MYAFQGYCYPGSAELVAAAASYIGQGAGAWVLDGVSVSGGNLVLSYLDATGASQSLTSPLVACSDVGPLATHIGTGITVGDAATLSFSVVLVWLVGYSVAAIRRTLDDLS